MVKPSLLILIFALSRLAPALAAAEAPDPVHAAQARNEQIASLLQDPAKVTTALESAKDAAARAAENSCEQLTARFHEACALYILNEPAKAKEIQNAIDHAIRFSVPPKEREQASFVQLKQKVSHLESTLGMAEAIKDPANAVHVFYAPWHGEEIHGGLGINRRIADLAFNLRDFPLATKLYAALEQEATSQGQREIQAWCHMQRGRLCFINQQSKECEAYLISFLAESPYQEAKCAPFALLRLGVLYLNNLHNQPRAIEIFETASKRFEGTPEGRTCLFYRAMIPAQHDQPKEAIPLLQAFVKKYPDSTEATFITGSLIPELEKKISSAVAAVPAPPKSQATPPVPAPDGSAKPAADVNENFATLEQIHSYPARARDAIAHCKTLHPALCYRPDDYQKLNYYWAVALANTGDLKAAAEKFDLAASDAAPNQALAHQALNTHIEFLLREPGLLQQARALIAATIARAPENSPGQLSAKYHHACSHYINDDPEHAQAESFELFNLLQAQKHGNPTIEALKRKNEALANLITRTPSAPHLKKPYFTECAWPGKDTRSAFSMRRRIADLAFASANYPLASHLYRSLETQAAHAGQNELQAWCRLHRGRILILTKKPEEAAKLLSSFRHTAPYKNAKCAPFALLRLGIICISPLNDKPRAINAFQCAAARFPDAPETLEIKYHLATTTLALGKKKEALALMQSFVKKYPKEAFAHYFENHCIGNLKAQIAADRSKKTTRSRATR